MKVESINPVVRQLSQYATDKMFAAMSGNYKEFKNASKAFGKLASKFGAFTSSEGSKSFWNSFVF